MFAEEVVRATVVYVATFAFAWRSAMIPFVNVELFMLGTAPTVSADPRRPAGCGCPNRR